MKTQQSGFEDHIDREYLLRTLQRLLKVDCSVPLGPDTLMEPDHPKLVHYVQEVIRPELVAIGVNTIYDVPKNQIVAKMGSGETDASLLIMAYTPVQHYNWMKDPLSAKIGVPVSQGVNEPCAYGQGASQNMAHFTAMLTVLKAFMAANVKLRGTLYFGANNEGRSSHECSTAMIQALTPKPKYGVVLIGGGNNLSVANRGRVDVVVHIHGKVTHSSAPDEGISSIDGVVEALNRIRALKFAKKHPQLGGQHAVPYQVVYDPIAPHTLPGYARIKIDRRLLPGDDIGEAVEQIRSLLQDMAPWTVTVEQGVHMLPSVVDLNSPIVMGIQKAIKSIDGVEAEPQYWKGAYDAGGPTSLGIPTIMYGRPAHGTSLMDDDFVSLKGVEEEALILGKLIVDMLA